MVSRHASPEHHNLVITNLLSSITICSLFENAGPEAQLTNTPIRGIFRPNESVIENFFGCSYLGATHICEKHTTTYSSGSFLTCIFHLTVSKHKNFSHMGPSFDNLDLKVVFHSENHRQLAFYSNVFNRKLPFLMKIQMVESISDYRIFGFWVVPKSVF